ncbi:MAG: AAA family ATPase [Nocardioidaceae bacterium]|nr:AAA family ATPase [Nocardioidaceae bacterium]
MRGLPSWYVDDEDDVAMPGARVRVLTDVEHSDDEQLRMSDIGKLARRARRRIVGAARADDRPTFAGLISDHLGVPLEGLEVVEESWPSYDLVNVQVGLNVWLEETGPDASSPQRTYRLVGLANYRHREFGLTDLLQRGGEDYGPTPGNVSWSNLASGPDGRVQRAVRAGLYLVTDGEARSAILVLAADPESGMGAAQLQVVSNRPGVAGTVAKELRQLALVHNVFRGQVISFGREMFGERGAALQFHRRPALSADDVILPAETLAAISRQVVGVATHRQRLLAAHQHLKRGLLLYGPPGVGKTHSVRYLTSQLFGVTIVQLTGDSLRLIGTACSVARALQPAMVVVEDVDLIAEDRGMHPGHHPLLFQLLNEMDGLAEDADVVFLLTTNRADVLEPALAARPGRVDQAVPLNLPDADARRCLIHLYRGALVVDESRLNTVIARTEGVTASFLKELLRRSALIAASESRCGDIAVTADQLDTALDELLDTRNAMTRVLLGGGKD